MTVIINWIKTNWIAILVFVVILAGYSWIRSIIFQSEIESVQEQAAEELAAQRKAHESQVVALNKSIQQGMEKQKEITLQYQEKLESLDQKYNEKIMEIEELRKVKMKELAKEIKKKPETVLEDLASKFGFEIVAVTDDEPECSCEGETK